MNQYEQRVRELTSSGLRPVDARRIALQEAKTFVEEERKNQRIKQASFRNWLALFRFVFKLLGGK